MWRGRLARQTGPSPLADYTRAAVCRSSIIRNRKAIAFDLKVPSRAKKREIEGGVRRFSVGKRGRVTNPDVILVYVLVAAINKRPDFDAFLYILLQILSPVLFEKMSLQQAFTTNTSSKIAFPSFNRLILFDF
jgi:hypothetical protein